MSADLLPPPPNFLQLEKCKIKKKEAWRMISAFVARVSPRSKGVNRHLSILPPHPASRVLPTLCAQR